MTKPSNPTNFASNILNWYHQYGRKDLPWQKTKDPYKIWVSEIMLQQTQVATVIPYYTRFMESFKTVIELANAPQDTVLHHWTGLGYYARARNLHKTAQIIRDNCNGIFPDEFDAVLELPGIGKSTAGAILSFSKDQHHAILDGNVKRVLSRYFGVLGWSGQSATQKQLWQLATTHTPEKQTAHYTQAIMDFGATLCKRSKPSCEICPLNNSCFAYTNALTKDLPTPKPKKSTPIRKSIFLIIKDQSARSLLIQRPPSGIWGSLWCFPEISLDGVNPSAKEIDAYAENNLGCKIKKQKRGKVFRHTFSHFHLDITPITATLFDKAICLNLNDTNSIWYDPTQHLQIGLAAPIKTLLTNQ